MALVIGTRPLLASAAAWTVGAAVSIAVGLLALSLVGPGLRDAGIDTLPPQESGDLLSATHSPPPSAVVDPTLSAPTSSSHAAPTDRMVNTAGGSLVARCSQSGAFLVYWTPAPGYRADNVRRGPAPTVHISFAGTGREISVDVRCVAGSPVATTRSDE
jgi:hypothetical protein